MSFLVNYATGFIEIRLSGNGLERFINLCGKRQILLWDICWKQNEIICKTTVRGFKAMKPMARKTHTKVRILSKSGVPFLFFRYRKRTWFLPGLGLAVFLLMLSSGYIWKINIEGNSRISDEKILQVMQEHAWYYGTRKTAIDPEEIETQLRNTFSEIAWSSIDIKGTCMTVFIKENLLLEERDNAQSADSQEAAHMVADMDGTVVSIVTRQGMPAVTAGTQVKKGDVLISGVIPITDAYDVIMDYQGTVAEGDVILRCSLDYQQSFSMSYQKRVYTGRRHHYFYLTDLAQHMTLPVFWNNFDDYDTIHYYRQPCIQENFYLPVQMHEVREREFYYQKKTYSKKEAQEKAKEQLQVFLHKLEEKGIPIIEKNVKIIFADNQCVSKGTIVVDRNEYQMQAAEIPVVDHSEGQNTDESQ